MLNNEEQFISYISKSFKSIRELPDDWIGIGDDAAKIVSESKNIVFCADAMVEDVHFKRNYGFESIGWKSIVSNQSDLAGMGAKPLAFTVTLGLNKSLNESNLKSLYIGMDNACNEFGGFLIGGDVVKSEKFFISISAIGIPFQSDNLLLRSNAKKDDIVAVTGSVGDAAAGHFIIENKLSGFKNQQNKFLYPKPKFLESKKAIELGITCGMDLSDGLSKDLLRICKSSNVEIEIELEKISSDENLKKLYKDNFYSKIASSGEDYEIIIIGEKNKIKALSNKMKINIIGKVTKDKKTNLVFKKNNKKTNIELKGFDHFE